MAGNHWLRLWHDLPNDPKWRTVSKISGQPISLVLATYLHLLVGASQAEKRGVTQCNAEDLSSALDCDKQQVEAIWQAMEGRVREGDRLTGWDRRQPQREDNSTDRVQKFRETQSNAVKRSETLDKDKDKDKDKESTKTLAQAPPAGTRIPDNFAVTQEHRDFAASKGYENPDSVIDAFCDYWRSIPGAKGKKLDWDATLRVWLSRTNKPRAPSDFQPPKKLNPNLYREQ